MEHVAQQTVCFEKLSGFLEGHVENVSDCLLFPAKVVELGTVARAMAVLASHVGIGKKIHLELDLPGPFAGFATAVGCIERKGTGAHATHLCFGQVGKETSDDVHCAHVGGRC